MLCSQSSYEPRAQSCCPRCWLPPLRLALLLCPADADSSLSASTSTGWQCCSHRKGRKCSMATPSPTTAASAKRSAGPLLSSPRGTHATPLFATPPCCRRACLSACTALEEPKCYWPLDHVPWCRIWPAFFLTVLPATSGPPPLRTQRLAVAALLPPLPPTRRSQLRRQRWGLLEPGGHTASAAIPVVTCRPTRPGAGGWAGVVRSAEPGVRS